MLNIIIEEYEGKPDRHLLHKILENQHIMLGKISLEFHLLNIKIDQIMTKAEFIQGLTDLKTEIDGVSTKVDALEAAINNAGSVIPQDVQDAFTALKGGVDTLNTKADNTPVTPPVV